MSAGNAFYMSMSTVVAFDVDGKITVLFVNSKRRKRLICIVMLASIGETLVVCIRLARCNDLSKLMMNTDTALA